MNKNKQHPVKHSQTNWTALQYFNIYRILLSAMFVVLISLGQLPEPLGIYDVKLFSYVGYSYLIIAVFLHILINRQFFRYNLQIALHAVIDIFMLSLMMYASNGLSSGFGMLIVIAVAGASILRAGKISILIAAIATLAVLGHEVYVQFSRFYHSVNYIHAGILGASFFFTAIIGNLLSARVKQTEALAEQQAIEINELARLNEHIVQRMQSGILVLNQKLDALLFNESAKALLKQKDSDTGKINHFIDQYLKKPIQDWIQDNTKSNVIVRIEESNIEMQASFIKLDSGQGYQLLVFLEDIALIRQKAQQLKLASLGRLAASIAHEVRNPLGAINHAGQLLKESDSISEEDKRLTDIINNHSVRVNGIIENVLDLGRRQQATLDEFELVKWLKQFVYELLSQLDLPNDVIKLKSYEVELKVKMDRSQLHQIMWNLCENALRYSHTVPAIIIHCGEDLETKRTYIEIEDFGGGMNQEVQDQLFEPFFTTESQGTGLGLYLAKELCEANQVNLNLVSSTKSGTTFKLTFMHINKQSQLN